MFSRIGKARDSAIGDAERSRRRCSDAPSPGTSRIVTRSESAMTSNRCSISTSAVLRARVFLIRGRERSVQTPKRLQAFGLAVFRDERVAQPIVLGRHGVGDTTASSTSMSMRSFEPPLGKRAIMLNARERRFRDLNPRVDRGRASARP